MNTLLRTFTLLAALVFATTASAGEETISLGSKGYYDTIEIDLREYGVGGYGGSAVLYCDGDLVFSADLAGVTYAAPGIYYWVDYYGFYHVTQLPSGDYTGGLSVIWGGTFSSSSYNNVTWLSNDGQTWLVVDFL